MPQPPSLRELLREDFRRHDRSLTMPGFQALALHRVRVVVGSRSEPWAKVLRVALSGVNVLIVRNVYGMELYASTVIGRRVRIGHHMGVVLGRGAVIGDDCLIRQHVTLGQVADVDTGQPRIGNGVEIGAGASVLGNVVVGDGAVIGPHALVVKDLPAGATAMASPARVLRAAGS